MIVIGVGNAWRGDDGAGLAVARRVAAEGGTAHAHEGDCAALVELWSGADHAVVVDAARSGAPAGTVRHFDAAAAPLPAAAVRSGTHAFGVADAVELARALGRLPARLDVYAIEGGSFAAGDRLTPAVARAVAALAGRLGSRDGAPMTGSRRWSELSRGQRRTVVALGAAQLSLQAAALIDLARRPAAEVNGDKRVWAAVTFVNWAGPLAYFARGRRR